MTSLGHGVVNTNNDNCGLINLHVLGRENPGLTRGSPCCKTRQSLQLFSPGTSSSVGPAETLLLDKVPPRHCCAMMADRRACVEEASITTRSPGS